MALVDEEGIPGPMLQVDFRLGKDDATLTIGAGNPLGVPSELRRSPPTEWATDVEAAGRNR